MRYRDELGCTWEVREYEGLRRTCRKPFSVVLSRLEKGCEEVVRYGDPQETREKAERLLLELAMTGRLKLKPVEE